MAKAMEFKDDEHENYFYKFIKKADISKSDNERIALFYILALFQDTRNNINDLYDFAKGENCIKISGLSKGWQTGGTTRATKLAFNLYNGFRGEDRENENFSPLEIFSVDADNRNYMLLAIQIRFQ